jgi:hypothetical protein
MTKRAARYVIEVRDSNGGELLSTVVDWTDEERHAAINQILRWAGISRAAKTKRQETKEKKDKGA